MRSRRRGSLVVASLLLASIILLMGLGFLGKRRAQYQATLSQRGELMALGMAEAGLEDARLKLLKDQKFPPWQKDQQTFAYQESLPGGTYRVIVKRHTALVDPALSRGATFDLIVVESIGAAGPPDAPTASRRLQIEMRTRGRVASYRDLGGL